MMAWSATSSETNPAVFATMIPRSAAASWSILSNPWPKLTMACAVSIASITSRGMAGPHAITISAPFTASIVSPVLPQTWAFSSYSSPSSSASIADVSALAAAANAILCLAIMSSGSCCRWMARRAYLTPTPRPVHFE